MKFLLLVALLAADPDFPDVDAPVVDDDAADVVEPAADAPAALPTESFPDLEEPAPADKDWATKAVKPRDVTPGGAAPAGDMPEIRSHTATSAPARPAADAPAKSAADEGTAYITGYNDVLWNDTKATVQKRYPEDRPLLDKGSGKWLITDTCEGEEANVVYAFDDKGALKGVVCQFKRGIENATPDYPLYQKIRQALVKRWGKPAATNESPAPDSPMQAAEWVGTRGKASLAFSAEQAFVQLTVERRP